MSTHSESELEPDRVSAYLQAHPAFLETFVTGPVISKETFSRWSSLRNNKTNKDTKRHLITSYMSAAGRAQCRHVLATNARHAHRLTFELGLTCAQIARSDNFEILVPRAGAASGADSAGTNDASEPDVALAAEQAQLERDAELGAQWRRLVLVDNALRLRRPKPKRRPTLHVQKMVDCNERQLGEIHFFTPVSDRDAQYMNVLCNWGCAMIQFASVASATDANSNNGAADMAECERQRRLNHFLLEVVKSIFQDMNTMDMVVLKIMNFAQRLVDADRASLFLVDARRSELRAQVFDLGSQPDQNGARNGDAEPGTRTEIRFPMGRGVAGFVAQTGQGMNITDAYEDERFNPEIDAQTGYKTQTILCMPIFLRGNVIGVVQMVNKREGVFTPTDEEAFETFAIYCGLALHHAKLYDKIRRSEQKYRVALEVLAYHSVCNRDEVLKLKKVQLRECVPELDRFEFNGNRLSELEKPLYAVYMFKTLFKNIINIDADDVIRFTLTVRKNYRKVPYHNWTHGWTVAHAMFVFLRTTKIYRPLEALALFTAAICHDLDHRGKNNAYMKSMATPLAAIYSTSVMEHHHFNQTVTILQQDGHNVLKSLRPDEYRRVLGAIKHCILATDLALFFGNKARMNELVARHEFSWDLEEHRSLSQALLMTSCDLIATAKPWQVQTETVKVIFEEFYEQGDAERLNGREPIPMMDRNKAHELPQMQVGFLKGICLPCYESVCAVVPEAAPLRDRTLYNLKKWQELADEQKAKMEAAEQHA